MRDLWQDLGYALRQLRKNAGVSLAAVAILALGIAANSVTFTVLKATLLRALPYREPDRLVKLWETRTEGTFTRMEFSYPDFVDYRDRNQVFEGLGGYSRRGATLLGAEGAEQVDLAVCSANFFDVLGVKAAEGRLFRPGEDALQATNTVVLSYAGWQRRFGGDPQVLGKTLVVNDEPRVIIGVLPRNFEFAPSHSTEFWLPARVRGEFLRRNLHWFHPVGRLKPGIDAQQAQAALSTFAAQLAREYPDSNPGVGTQVVSLHEEIVGPVRPVLLLLMAAVACVLLITCGNLAGLLLTNAISRQKEISIRLALGASRWRIVRQLLTESCLLSVFGGLTGAALSLWLLPAAMASIPKEQLLDLPAWQNLHVDLSFLLVSLGLALLTGILFGLAPALLSFRPQLRATLQETGRSSAGPGRSRLRSVLVVAEIALAIVLLQCGGLMLKSLSRVLRVDPGFQTSNLLTLGLRLPSRSYPKAPDMVSFHDRLLEKISALPGVRGAATTDTLPLTGGSNTSRFVREGHRSNEQRDSQEANSRDISPNYFTVMGIPLRAGRFFTDGDKIGTAKVAIINHTLAERMFPGENPIGQRIDFTYTKEPNLWQIVGIVGDENATALDAVPNPVIYTPFAQSPDSYLYVAVRTAQPPELLSSTVQHAVREMDSAVSIFEVQSMADIIAQSPSIFFRRTPAYVTAVFAGIGLLLAAVGLYSLLAYGVAQRRREMGIRLALGAQRADLVRLILGSGLKLAAAGVTLGVVCALAVSRLLATFLFGVQPADPTTLAGVCILLFAIALVATSQPARRAANVDPIVALREE